MDDEVPEWCSFLTADDFERFAEAADEALSSFGIEGQDVWTGTVSLAAGSPTTVAYDFPVEPLAVACRDVPAADWADTCFSMIHRWIDGTRQRTWLAERSFDEVADRLDVWLAAEPARLVEEPPEHPDQPYFAPMLTSVGVSLWVRVPELGDLPSIPALVPNAAVEAWGVSFVDLARAWYQRLLRLPPPEWDTATVHLLDDAGRRTADVEIHRVVGEPADVPLPTAWWLALDTVSPLPVVPGTLLAMPVRQLMLVSFPDPNLTDRQRLSGLMHHADNAWRAAEADRLTSWAYLLDDELLWQPVLRDDD